MASAAIDAAGHNPTNQNNVFRKACFIWGMAALFYFYDQLLQQTPSAMREELTGVLINSRTEFGHLNAFFLWSYGLMQIPVGLLMDRFGPRRLLAFACALTVLGSFFFSSATGLPQALLGRALTGVGAAFAVVGCTKIAGIWFSDKRFAFFTGLMVTIGFLGNAAAMSLLPEIVLSLGWRNTLLSWMGLGTALTLLIWLVVRDKPSAAESRFINHAVSEHSSERKINLFQSLSIIVSCPQSWISSLYASLMFVPTLALAAWGISFLKEAYGFSLAEAGYINSFIFMGWMFGAPFFGWVSDKIGKRNPPMAYGGLGTLIACLAYIYAPGLPAYLLMILLFLVGFCSSAFILAFATIRENNPAFASGTAIGFINMFNTFGGAIAQSFIGNIQDAVSTGAVDAASGAPANTLYVYHMSFLTIPVAVTASLLILFFLKETYCRQRDDKLI